MFEPKWLASSENHACCKNRQCLLLQEQTSVLSQHARLLSQKFQLWQCLNVDLADRRSGSKLAKMARNGSRMVAKPRESTQVNPTAISERSGSVPRPKNCKKNDETLRLYGLACSRPRPLSSTPQDLWGHSSPSLLLARLTLDDQPLTCTGQPLASVDSSISPFRDVCC